MKEFDKSGKFGKSDSGRGRGSDSRRDSGRSSSFGRSDRRDSGRSRDRAPPTMTEVTCDKCGKQCEVPFKPTSNKPIFCRDCFKQNEPSDSGRRFSDSRRSSDARPDNSSEEFEKINKKLDKIMKLLNADEE